MNQWDDIILYSTGSVDFSNIQIASFEFIKDLYEHIKPCLDERRARGIPEASTGKAQKEK